MIVRNIRGVDYRVLKDAPENLRELYAQGMDKSSFIARAIEGWYGDREWTFMVYQDERYTFRQAYAKAAQLAWRLKEDYGVKKGDRVAVAMRNYPEFCLSFMAATALGALAVPLNAWWSGPELEYGLRNSGSKLIFADQERADRIVPFLKDLNISMVVARPDRPLPEGAVEFNELTASSDETEFPPVEIAADDDAYMMYTSGSTGNPKGVVTTHRAVTNTVMSWEFAALGLLHLNREHLEEIKPENKSSCLLTVPLFHVTGLVSPVPGLLPDQAQTGHDVQMGPGGGFAADRSGTDHPVQRGAVHVLGDGQFTELRSIRHQ